MKAKFAISYSTKSIFPLTFLDEYQPFAIFMNSRMAQLDKDVRKKEVNVVSS